MLRLRTLLLSGLAAASVPLSAACAPALDFDSLTRGEPKTDASEDGTIDAQVDALEASSLLDAASDSPSPMDAGSDSPDDSSSSTDAVEEYAANPCANVPPSADGYYCGRTTQSGFSGGNPLDLYHCVNGMATSVMCTNGCFIAPLNFQDECDYCNTVADGTYCGSQFGYFAPSSHLLIVCSAGHVPDGGITPCSISCVVDGGAHCGP